MSDVEQFFKKYEPDVRDIALKLREVVLKTVPDATEKLYTGWSNVGYSHGSGMKSQFCAIAPMKDRVNFYFMRGIDLPDPKAMLEGTGKGMRHVKVRTLKEANSRALKTLVKEAAARSKTS